jgi:hypothetical protein
LSLSRRRPSRAIADDEPAKHVTAPDVYVPEPSASAVWEGGPVMDKFFVRGIELMKEAQPWQTREREPLDTMPF